MPTLLPKMHISYVHSHIVGSTKCFSTVLTAKWFYPLVGNQMPAQVLRACKAIGAPGMSAHVFAVNTHFLKGAATPGTWYAIRCGDGSGRKGDSRRRGEVRVKRDIKVKLGVRVGSVGRRIGSRSERV